MPTYSTPGVYVNEKALSNVIPSVTGGNAAVFFGSAERGPTEATLVNDWASYKRIYGDLKDAYDLGYAVYHYFANGGRSAYVVRAAGTYDSTGTTAGSVTPVAASASINYNPQGGATTAVLFDAEAVSTGAWGNGLGVTVSSGLVATTASAHGTFNVVITLDGVEVERWSEVTLDRDGNRFVGAVINNYSQYINIDTISTEDPDASLTLIAGEVALANGVEGIVGPADIAASVDAIDSIRGNLVLNAVGQTSSTAVTPLINKAASRGDSFVIIDPDKTSESLSALQTVASTFSGLSNGGYAAHYTPALVMVDPAKNGPAAIRTTYPGGAVAGLMIRNDTQRSVAKAPAGYGADIRGALGMAVRLSDADIGTLYDGSPYVNSFKAVAGAGIVVYGARTLSRTTSDKFIPVRRTVNYLKYTLKDLTEFAVFEPNDQNLWNRINLTLSGFLASFYRSGGLKGDNASQAFYIVCNDTNNTVSSIAEGVVNVEVGVALQYPAEFIVINLSQWSGGSNTVEAL